MKLPVSLQELNQFLNTASENCYLGEFKRAETTERPGFFEMEYTDGDLNYRDSFVGFYQSAGTELIRYKNIPIWATNYGGGVTKKYVGDEKFFNMLEQFLIKSLSLKSKEGSYMPRGPGEYIDGDFKYKCDWTGEIDSFSGLEEIFYKNEKVFFHNFFGGIIMGKSKI